MKSKLKATLLCTLMIASALAGCAGSDDDDEDPAVEDVLGCTYADAENYNLTPLRMTARVHTQSLSQNLSQSLQ